MAAAMAGGKGRKKVSVSQGVCVCTGDPSVRSYNVLACVTSKRDSVRLTHVKEDVAEGSEHQHSSRRI